MKIYCDLDSRCNPNDFKNPTLTPINYESIKVIDSDDTYTPPNPYVKIDKEYQNLKSLFENVCKTKNVRL